jgi:hypothetical protein
MFIPGPLYSPLCIQSFHTTLYFGVGISIGVYLSRCGSLATWPLHMTNGMGSMKHFSHRGLRKVLGRGDIPPMRPTPPSGKGASALTVLQFFPLHVLGFGMENTQRLS